MMERDEIGQLPPETWCHILTFVEDFDDTNRLKFVDHLFYHELASRDPFKGFDASINFSRESLQYFIQADTSYSLPRDRLLDALQRKLIGKGNDIPIKTIVLGKQDTGKTSFYTYFVRGFYRDNYEGGTIGASFWSKRLTDPDGVAAKFELWDTAGQERYNYQLPSLYFRGAQALMLCFSIDSRDSFVSLLNHFVPSIVKVFAAYQPSERPVMYLLGLKSDLESARQVPKSAAKAIARALKLKYFECSAKLGQNVNEVMEELKDDVLKSLRVPEPADKSPPVIERRWCSIQ